MEFIVLLLCVGLNLVASQQTNRPSAPCYDENNQPQRCQPPFVNAAYGKVVEATNTCGVNSVTEYCLQTGVTGARKYCYTCDDSDPLRRHPTRYLTDFNSNYNTSLTWWQSETMLERVQYPNIVNLTLHLNKAFDITYVRLRFYSPRPESFAIYKRSSEDGPWEPYQFYSASCDRTYGLPRDGIITTANEAQAICTAEYSDISPLTGGNVAFSTLEGRPSMFDFSRSPLLQDWVTATDIRIVLTRMNTFGDEVFGDPQVLKSYFYAISDLAVGARCKCNGHARECRPIRDQYLRDRLECVCEHFTTGPDCGECLPFYNDRPWRRATEDSAYECQSCNCNGLSERCEFDQELYDRTGHGGRCLNCRDNTAGVNCELCKVNHYRVDNRCFNCGCNPTGSLSLQCDDNGQCRCKPGVGGEKCDRCLPDFYDFGEEGCSPCACLAAGSLNNEPICNSQTGRCSCKENVDGRQCDMCKPGFFGLSRDNEFGCLSCFCFGHSSECVSASGFYARNISTNFDTGAQGWTAMDRGGQDVLTQYNGITQNLGVSAESNQAVYFTAPVRYHGDQRFSYNQFLVFDLRIGEETSRPSVVDIIIEGGSGQKISIHIFAQSNPVPEQTVKTFAFRLHENPKYQWTPRLQSTDFISILSNITAIKIRATYSDQGVGFIDNIHLGTASQGFDQEDEEALWVELCTCPKGYIGQFCESCAQGYKRDIVNGGPFSKCVPCTCNGHSDSCDINTGRCICQDNTEGDFCGRCARGYYGDATQGTEDDCKPCPCPDGGPCIQLPNSDVICTECKEGYGGNLCDMCLDGFYGDPTGAVTGTPTPCTKCTCNGNIDPNAVGNCNTTTGECLKCVRNTGGFYCEQCLPDFYNNTVGQCTACNCYSPGTVSQPGTRGCDVRTGQCLCLPHVTGRQCERCEVGYWDLASGQGCKACECSTVGSSNYTCDEVTGQCQCKPGVTSRQCDKCDIYFYGFSNTGCIACNCDPIGSLSLLCDENGNCPCRDNVAGRKCDRCMENKYDISAGCLDCPQCYNLVQTHVNNHRGKLRELTTLIEKTIDNPSLFNDTEFVARMGSVNDSINVLLQDARGASTGDGTIGQQLDSLRRALQEVLAKSARIARNIATASVGTEKSKRDVMQAEEAVQRADNALRMAENYIDMEGRKALSEAIKALASFGQISKDMTNLARDAAAAARKQTEEAELIENLAQNALDTSREAYRLANETLNMPSKTQDEIDRLRREYDDANQFYKTTKDFANNTLKRATMARDEALSLLGLAQDQLPSIDVELLKKEAEDIKEQAQRIKDQAETLTENNQDLLARVRNQTDQANTLLDQGEGLNREIANLLAEVDYARAIARKAVEDAKRTLDEASDTLKTLEEFDKLVDKEKEAKDALDKADEIKEIIQQARNLTAVAQQALAGVVADAQRALELAKEAEEKANLASQEAMDIRDRAGTTEDSATDLKSDASELNDNVNALKDDVDSYEMQMKEDHQMAEDALTRAATAKNDAEKAFNDVKNALDSIKTIQDQLKDISTIDEEDITRLEEEVARLRNLTDEAEINKKMEELSRQNEKIKEQADRFDLDLSQLIADVENIGDIKNSLPEGCFKNIPIEFPAN